MKEEFFSKFRDYNNELEKILEKKDFSKDSKNLLLSMFYKLEISYNDYETVKRKVKTKQEYLENILDNIKQCNKIDLLKPNTKKFDEFRENQKVYDVDLKLKKINVIDNEVCLLSAILELNDFKIYLNEQYNLIRNAFPYLLNSANDMANTEVLRDFNAFSWNTVAKDIDNIYINLVYENLKISMSMDIIEKLKNTNEIVDLINLIKEDLNKTYEEKITNKFLKLLFQISIIIYIQKSSIEKKRLYEEKEIIEEELKKIKDKKNYINNVIETKLELANKVKEKDLILHDKELLAKEYEKRNNNLSDYNKIFSVSHLTEKMQRERDRLINKIEECNQKLEPKRYIEDKQKLQEDFDLLKDIKFEDDENNKKLLYKYINKLQVVFLKNILPKKIENLNTKEELIDLVYQIRYYNFIPYTLDENIKDVNQFKGDLDSVLAILIRKLYKLRIINTMSTNEKNDIEIVKNIFYIRMISLEEVYLELLNISGNNYQLNIYDDKDTLEESINIKLEFNKKDKVKLKRKVKLFQTRF